MRRQGRWVEVRFWWAESSPADDRFRWAAAHPALAVLTLLALTCLACEDEPPRLLRQGDPEAALETWRENSVEVPADHPLLARAEAIFERVRKKSGVYAELVVLDIPDAPLALALADRIVVLSSGGLELCYRDVPAETGDARLAFVLGHEVAHVASNDFWHASAFATVRDVEDPTQQAERLQELLRQDARDRQVMELKADDRGMLALIQAGYDPRPLLDGDRTFFEEWTGGLVGSAVYDDPSHPGVRERGDFARERLKDVAAMERIFEQGVEAFQRAEELAATAERERVPPEVWTGYKEAVKAFDAVSLVFPGREVLSNLALAHLRLAAGRLADCDGMLVNRYYLPTALDPVTLASRARRRGSPDYSSPCFENEDYQQDMKAAIRLLEDAVESDSDYVPARLNLIAAFVLDEQEASAHYAAMQARERWPDDPAVAAAHSGAVLAYFDTGSTLMDPKRVMKEIEELHRRFPDEPGIAFNLASALSYQGRLEKARPVWEAFLRVEPGGAWAKIARERIGDDHDADRVAATR